METQHWRKLGATGLVGLGFVLGIVWVGIGGCQPTKPEPPQIKKPLPFLICGDTVALEMPSGFDTLTVFWIDSLVSKSDKLIDYQKAIWDYHDTIRNNPAYNLSKRSDHALALHQLHFLHKIHWERSIPFQELYFELEKTLLRADFLQLAQYQNICDPASLSASQRFTLAETLYFEGQMEKAQEMYEKNLVELDTTVPYEKRVAGVAQQRLAFISAEDDLADYGQKIRGFYPTLEAYIAEVEKFRMDESFDAWEQAYSKLSEAPYFNNVTFSDFDRKYLRSEPDYTLALGQILIEDLQGERLLVKPEILEEVRQAFRDYNQITRQDIDLYIYAWGSLGNPASSWSISFVARGASGLVNANFEGYLFTYTDTIDFF